MEWQSPMRDRRRYRLLISKKGYSGLVGTLHGRDDVVSIAQGGADDDELMPIKASELSLSILCTEDGEPYTELFTLDPLAYSIDLIENDEAESRDVIRWRGYLAAGSYSQPMANPPYRVELRANDGLAVLKTIPYLDEEGNRYSDVVSVKSIVNRILGYIGGIATFGSYEPLTPKQAGDTFDIVGLTSISLYSSFGEETPTCYDVLEAVLSNFGLQLFQTNGRWVVRSIYSLCSTADDSRPEQQLLYDYSGKGQGLSSSATLSLLPPLARVEGDAAEAAYEAVVTSTKDYRQWKPVLIGGTIGGYPGGIGAILDFGDNSGKAYVFTALLESAAQASLSLAMKVYNRTMNEQNALRCGCFLTDASDDPLAWLAASGNKITIAQKVAGWNAETSAWELLEQSEQRIDDALTPYTSQLALPASPVFYPNFRKASPRALASADLSLSYTSLSPEGMSSMRLVLLFWSTGAAYIEVAEANVNIEQQEVAQAAPLLSDGRVSKYGLEQITYNQTFPDTWPLPISNSAFISSLIDVRTGKPISGFVVPSLRSSLRDVVCAGVKHLRSKVIRQLEGDVYIPEVPTMSTVWRDRDGKAYYANQITHQLRRGLISAQLRELPPLLAEVPAVALAGVVSPIGLDSSAVYVSADRLRLSRFDLYSGLTTSLRESIYPMYTTKGYNCVCVVEVITAGVCYNLHAYDDSGELVSTAKVTDITTLGVNIYTSDVGDALARSARYNPYTGVWVLAATLSSGNSSRVGVVLLDAYGNLIRTLTYIGVGYMFDANDVHATLNGYMLNFPLKDITGGGYSRWHDFGVHEITDNPVYLDGYVIRGVTDKLIVAEDLSQQLLHVFATQDAALSVDIAAPIFSVSTSVAEYVDMNNAIVLFQNPNSGGGYAYDARTGTLFEYDAVTMPTLGQKWLSSDYLCVAYRGNVLRTRIAAAIPVVEGSDFNEDFNEDFNI